MTHQSDKLDSFNPDDDKAIFEQSSIKSTESGTEADDGKSEFNEEVNS